MFLKGKNACMSCWVRLTRGMLRRKYFNRTCSVSLLQSHSKSKPTFSKSERAHGH